MEPEVLTHTTAPFFKGLDQDAGLGLSMAQAWQSSQEAACTYIAIQDSEQQLRSGYQWQPSEQPGSTGWSGGKAILKKATALLMSDESERTR